MEKFCVTSVVFCLSVALFLQSPLAEEIPIINGNISVVLQNLEVNLLVLKGDEVIRHVQYALPNSPILRPPCRTCDPTYNQFPISNQYLIPNHSKIYVVNPNSMARPSEVDIKNCDPVKLYSIKSNVIWVQCTFENGQFEVVELRRKNNMTWYRHDSQNIGMRPPLNVSRGGLVLVKEKDGENVTFLYYGQGSRLARKGLKEFSSALYPRTSSLCKSIEELFYVNDELILIQCVLKDVPTDRGLVLFNTSNPSQSLTLFNRWQDSKKVHVFEGFVVLLSHNALIIQHALRYRGIEQLIVFPPELSTSGIFVKLNDTINFVCTGMKNIYLIDIASILDGNITAYQRIESKGEICTDETCSPIQYTEPLLFVPMKANELAMYTIDPVELHATTRILNNHYRYFFTYTMPEIPLAPTNDITGNGTIVLESREEKPKSTSPGGGVIAGITVAAFVIILSIVVVFTVWYYQKKRKSLRYYQYRTAEVRFERPENSPQEEGIVIVSGRFTNPVWQLNDTSTDAEEESNTSSMPTPPLNNQFATNMKKKITNESGNYTAPRNVERYGSNDNDSEMSYGFETREEPVTKQQYVDSLVIGTFGNSII